jgi:hypothetical protein
MVPPRHRFPTPPWAELPPGAASSSDAFQPFATDAFISRPIAPIGAASFGLLAETQPILGDEDNDAPKVSSF